MPAGDVNKNFQMGAWLVQPDLNRLVDGDRVVTLQPRMMGMLVCLASRPGKIIRLGELLDTVWDGRAHADNTIYQAAAHLRKALGDDTHNPRYIETIPKKGYRLICPVVPASSDDELGATSETAIGRRFAAIAASIALLSVVIVFAVDPELRSRLLPARDIPSDKSVAVLPFVDMSEDGNQQFLSDGISEDLIHVLSNLPEMRVTARTSSFAFRDKNADIREIGNKLNVATILEGSVRKDGNRIRITSRLVDTSDGYHLWSKTFDQDASDLFSIQSEIAAAVATAFYYPQQDVMATSDRRAQSNELQAYEFYLLGMYHLHKLTSPGRELAVQYFERAIESDPSFARAYAGLAEIYALQARRSNLDLASRSDIDQEALRKAESTARHALRLDDQSAAAYYSLGLANLFKRNFPDAKSAFAKAIELKPNDARAYARLSDTYYSQGKKDEAFLVLKRALELNPMSGMLNTRTGDQQYELSGGDWGSAFSYYQQAMDNEPDWPYSYYTVGYHFWTTGQHDRAFPYAKRYMELFDNAQRGGRLMIPLYLDLGEYDAAMNLIRRMQEAEPHRGAISDLEIQVLLARGDFSTARRLVHSTLSTNVGDPVTTGDMALYEMIIGDTEHAKELYAQLEPSPEPPNMLGEANLYRLDDLDFGWLGAVNLAYLQKSSGETQAAEELLRNASEWIAAQSIWIDPGKAYVSAQIAVVEGNKEAAINLFRDAVDAGWSKAWYARIDPIMANLREDARFLLILEELEARLSKMREKQKMLASNDP